LSQARTSFFQLLLFLVAGGKAKPLKAAKAVSSDQKAPAAAAAFLPSVSIDSECCARHSSATSIFVLQAEKDYSEEDKAFLERKKAEEKALKEAAAKLKGKK
jgi:Translation machinery associated TMA7